MQTQISAPTPAASGLDAFRVLFTPPTQPVDGVPTLHEAPALTERSVSRVIERFESLGYTFVRAERQPEGCVSSEWPWEEIKASERGES